MKSILLAVFITGLCAVPSMASQTQPCDLAPAVNVGSARVKATCVTARATMSAKAARLHSGYKLRVEANACSHFEINIWRCRFSGSIGNSSCHGIARTYGASRDPAALRARVTYFVCAL